MLQFSWRYRDIAADQLYVTAIMFQADGHKLTAGNHQHFFLRETRNEMFIRRRPLYAQGVIRRGGGHHIRVFAKSKLA